ncbi:porin [Benzoatithermus flavus]|uniref:Porin n=1 Tax=Benzoatithermus flavus TaxID=3108223 RepID=A0ABU8XLM1_9PROT
MTLRKILLGTTAVVGVGLTVAAVPTVVGAAEVKPGGYPDLTLTGFARFRAHGGEIDDARLNNAFSRDLDFSNDTEVHVVARAKDERTGIEYGGTIEFEADTNSTANTDESWLFVRGGFGEVRLGDEDGVAHDSEVGGNTIAAGTGGIDGSVIDTIATPVVFLTNTDDATKIRYYTPSFGGFQIAVSYTPQDQIVGSGAANGDALATKGVEAQNVVDGGLIYKGEFAGVGVLASVVGITGDLKGSSVFGDGSWHGWQAGASVDLFGFKVAGSYGDEKVADADRTWITAGAAYGIGPANVSVSFGKVIDDNGFWAGRKPYNLVFSADYALMPGLVLAGDVGFFDNSARPGRTIGAVGDSGWQAVGRLGLAF